MSVENINSANRSYPLRDMFQRWEDSRPPIKLQPQSKKADLSFVESPFERYLYERTITVGDKIRTIRQSAVNTRLELPRDENGQLERGTPPYYEPDDITFMDKASIFWAKNSPLLSYLGKTTQRPPETTAKDISYWKAVSRLHVPNKKSGVDKYTIEVDTNIDPRVDFVFGQIISASSDPYETQDTLSIDTTTMYKIGPNQVVKNIEFLVHHQDASISKVIDWLNAQGVGEVVSLSKYNEEETTVSLNPTVSLSDYNLIGGLLGYITRKLDANFPNESATGK